MYNVVIQKKMLRNLHKMPEQVQKAMANLVEDLRDKGPVRNEWPNFSRLGQDRYHCHLAYKWIACWSHKKDSMTIEVYYAGSRENAPY